MRKRLVDPHKFRALRIRRRLTQAELAHLAGSSRSFVKAIEAGKQQPGDLYANAFCGPLDCTVEDFSDPKPGSDSSDVA